MITLARIFFPNDGRIIPLFTRAGSTKKSLNKTEKMATDYMNDFKKKGWNFANPIYVGEELSEELG